MTGRQQKRDGAEPVSESKRANAMRSITTPSEQTRRNPQEEAVIQRAIDAPGSLSAHEVLRLQQTIGNRAVQRLLSPDAPRLPQRHVQAKLTIGPANDRYEQEADLVAAQVINRLNTPLPTTNAGQNIQRQQTEEDEELKRKPLVQLQPVEGGMDVSPDLEASIQAARGGGQPLNKNVRTSMESAFGADFSGVKVHVNAEADLLNRSLQSRAFTTGQDIFFRAGEYAPDSKEGQRLLAHELTHVAQQDKNAAPTTRPRQTITPQIQRFAQSDVDRHRSRLIGASLPPNKTLEDEARIQARAEELYKSGSGTEQANYFQAEKEVWLAREAQAKVLSGAKELNLSKWIELYNGLTLEEFKELVAILNGDNYTWDERAGLTDQLKADTAKLTRHFKHNMVVRGKVQIDSQNPCQFDNAGKTLEIILDTHISGIPQSRRFQVSYQKHCFESYIQNDENSSKASPDSINQNTIAMLDRGAFIKAFTKYVAALCPKIELEGTLFRPSDNANIHSCNEPVQFHSDTDNFNSPHHIHCYPVKGEVATLTNDQFTLFRRIAHVKYTSSPESTTMYLVRSVLSLPTQQQQNDITRVCTILGTNEQAIKAKIEQDLLDKKKQFAAIKFK